MQRALAEISKRRANYEYFFERLSSPEWIAPLKENGLFHNPPPMEVDDRGVRAMVWAPSQYLARVASKAPAEVLDVMLGIETDNERTLADFAQAAASMPAPLARRWAERQLALLAEETRFYFVLPRNLAELIKTLATGSEVDAAFTLTEELFRLLPNDTGSDGSWSVERVTARFSEYEYVELLARLAPTLVEAAPERTIALLVDLLRNAIDLAFPDVTSTGEDNSHVWRPTLATDQSDHRELLQGLATVLRDTAVSVHQQGLLTDRTLLELLDVGETRIFRRVAFLALSATPVAAAEALTPLLVDRDQFFESSPSPEYRTLLGAGFSSLSSDGQQRLLDWITEGPNLDKYVAFRVQKGGQPPEIDEQEQYIAHWKIRRLRLIGGALPEDARRDFEDLIERYGDAEFVTGYEITGGWIGTQSPATLEELRTCSDDELIGLLERYEGTDGWFGPSREGLARTFSELAEGESMRVSGLAHRLGHLLPVHLYWMLIGLTKAIENDQPVLWQSLITLLQQVTVAPHGSADNEQGDEDNYGRWAWVRKESAAILETGFRSTTAAMPIELRQHAWDVVERLTEDTDPTPEYEQRYGGSNMDPATLALNTTRGRALHAAIAYALWVQRTTERKDGESATDSGFETMPEVRAVLERHLDPQQDPSLAVRAVYGQWFPFLALLDEQWAQRSSPEIFPDSDRLRLLRDAAWQSYIIFCRPYDSAFKSLRQEYSAAVDRLGTDAPPWRWIGGENTPDERLAVHLLSFYWRGVIDLGESDQLLERLFTNASDDTRKAAIGFLGRALCETETLDNRTRGRIERLWEWRLQEAQASESKTRTAEIAAFARWSDAELLDPAWRLEQLERILELGVSLRPESVALRAFEKLANQQPARTAHILRAFLEQERDSWTIQGGLTEIENILSTCLRSKNHDAIDTAIDTIHWLGSLGYGRFRGLIKSLPAD